MYFTVFQNALNLNLFINSKLSFENILYLLNI